VEQFDYQVKRLIQEKIDEKKENLLSQNLGSIEEYKYELGKLHALEQLMLDYQELNKKVMKDE
jgi:hypothetical protein|tara:strand:+ start:226 stop:414 length:189 start_codon:yes stop_codon:yes gene_type:complete